MTDVFDLLHFAITGIVALCLVIALVVTATWPLGKSRALLCASLLFQLLNLLGHIALTVWLRFSEGGDLNQEVYQVVSLALRSLGVLAVLCIVAFAVAMRGELARIRGYVE